MALIAGQGIKETPPTPVLLVIVAFCLACLIFGVTALCLPSVIVKANARLTYRLSVVRRRGQETVLPEWLFLLGVRTPEEALAKLRGMMNDPRSVVPGQVVFTRILGLFFTAFFAFVLAWLAEALLT